MAYFWLENDEDIKQWESTTKGNIYISNEYFFNNSNIILNQYPEFNGKLKSSIIGEVDIEPTVRSTQRTKNKKKYKKYYKGIDIEI